MTTNFPKETRKQDSIRLVNQLFKLIPMRENGEDWSSHLNIMVEEISGLAQIYEDKVESLILLSKLRGLNDEVCNDFMLYRKTVFRCMDLVSKVMSDE